jgi:hypothetical protein
MGSSRTSEGFFRGRAHGNIPKHADYSSVDAQSEVPVKGEVHLYLTDRYPRDIKFNSLKGESDIVVMVNVAESMAPILDKVAHKFSAVRSEYFFVCRFIYFNISFR